MTLLFFDGFESGSSAAHLEWVNGTNLTSSTVRTGSYALATGSATQNMLVIPASDRVIAGFAFLVGSTGTTPLLYLYGDNGATQHLSITMTPSAKVDVRRGTTAGTIMGTGTTTITLNVWHHLQVRANVHDTTGSVEVRVDGVPEVVLTNVDTKNAGTNTTIDRLQVVPNTVTLWCDDLWVCNDVDATATQGRPNNDFLGDLKVVSLFPSGAGDTTQFTPSTGANWSCVDDALSGTTTDFVTSSAAGQRDLYQLTDLPAGVQTVYAARISTYAQKSDAGLYGLKTVIKESGGTITVDPAPRALSTTYAGGDGGTYTRKPSNNGLWTPADINALQAGFDSVQM